MKGIGNLGNALLRPTEIYVKPVLEALKKCKINGLAHIMALSNRSVPEN